jgi:hypothetical protein
MNGIFYYRLTQYDYDGKNKVYDPISLQRSYTNKTIVKYINLLGQEVDPYIKGLVFEVYDDGTMIKIIR